MKIRNTAWQSIEVVLISPLAAVIMGGIIVFTFLTLVVAPVTFAILFGVKCEAQAPPKEHIGSSVREVWWPTQKRVQNFLGKSNLLFLKPKMVYERANLRSLN